MISRSPVGSRTRAEFWRLNSGRPQGLRMMLTVGETAAILGLSDNGTRKLDDILKPRRADDGRRIYNSLQVEKIRAIRAARKAPATQRRDRILARVDERGRK